MTDTFNAGAANQPPFKPRPVADERGMPKVDERGLGELFDEYRKTRQRGDEILKLIQNRIAEKLQDFMK